MEWVISIGIVLAVIFTIGCWIETGHNSDICFRDLSVFGKIARVFIFTVILGGIFTLFVLAIHNMIFG